MHIKFYLRLILNTWISLTSDFREGCYNVTHFVVESMGSIGNHQWLEITFAEDCTYFYVLSKNFTVETFQAKILLKFKISRIHLLFFYILKLLEIL